MGKTQKKNSKGRLDRYYYLAKEKGYRARSSFKIIQINEKFGHFLEKSKVVVDLCAAPGSWCQVASQLCPINSLIIGVDIVPIKPLPNCITFQSDITTEDCRSKLRGHMKTWKADTFLHDGAPNVGLGWVQDAFTQSQLTLQALKLAVEHLSNGGTFVTKIFRSRDYNNLMWVFQQLFDKVEATKPPASRNVSAEIFVVCKGFKAPKKLDPRLLDPREVFEELSTKKDNMQEKVFNPERKVRQRQGYEEGDYLLYHETSLMDFIQDEDPITILGSTNKITLPDKQNTDWKILKNLKSYSNELLECFKDLKVLGRKEFKAILKFRKQAREILQLDEDKDDQEKVEVEPLTEEQQIEKELQDLTEKQQQKSKREKKRTNELKQKEIYRNQMNMVTDMSLGIDAAQIGAESLFNLQMAKKSGQLEKLEKGKKRMIFNDEELSKDNDIHIDKDEDMNSEEEVDELEDQLDLMYQQYRNKMAEKNANLEAKRLRGDAEDEKWEGIKSDNESDDTKDYEMEQSDDESDFDSSTSPPQHSKNEGELSKNAAAFFADSIFKDVNDEDLINSVQTKLSTSVANSSKADANNSKAGTNSSHVSNAESMSMSDSEISSNSDSDDSDFEIVPAEKEMAISNTSDSEDDNHVSTYARAKTQKQKVEIATVEAMTLAHQVALGRMNKNNLIDEGINRYSFRDKEDLPEWFIDDEKSHSKLVKPITKEAALAIKEKQKELNSRPIKKVLEAQGRKKMRALKRLEKLKKKSDLINEDGAKSEKDKAEEISQLMRKLTKKQKQKPKVTLVTARGSNRGLSGRPKGVKGKYKMVDGVLKNEQRALKRIAKKHHK